MTRARELSKLGNPSVISADASNQVGIGSTTPDATLDVGGTGILVGSGASITPDGEAVFAGVCTATSFSGSGADLTGIAATDHVSTFDLDVAGISTFNDDVRIINGGLDCVGVITSNNKVVATGLDISTAGCDIDGQTDLDELQVAGVSTFSAKVVYTTAYPSVDADNEIQVGTAIQIGKAGVITATSFSGSGANLTDVVSGISLQEAGSWVTGSTGNPGGATPGTAATTFNFASGATVTEVSSGITTITISAALSTEAHVVTTEGVVNLNLGSAQDHKLTASGVTTVTCNGGTEGDSHTLRITNSGVSTVGFATYFLWPSGASPVIPIADGTISLISFTIQRPGAVGLGTQLLAGASLNFS